jgi:hypothetical protein
LFVPNVNLAPEALAILTKDAWGPIVVVQLDLTLFFTAASVTRRARMRAGRLGRHINFEYHLADNLLIRHRAEPDRAGVFSKSAAFFAKDGRPATPDTVPRVIADVAAVECIVAEW